MDDEVYAVDEVLDEVLQLLKSSDPTDRIEGAGELCEWVNSAYGDVGAALGVAVRQKGGIPVICKLWNDRELLVRQRSLLILGNLCSDRVDADSAETKAILLQCRAEDSLLACTWSDDPSILLLACGAASVHLGAPSWHGPRSACASPCARVSCALWVVAWRLRGAEGLRGWAGWGWDEGELGENEERGASGVFIRVVWRDRSVC